MTFRISVDAMGGDFTPLEAVKGACAFAQKAPDVRLLLAGREQELTALIKAECGAVPANISIHHAGQVVGMDDTPVNAVREMPDSSIAVAVDLVRQGLADTVLSAGNTGVAVAQATLGLKRIENVKRPGILSPFPSEKGIFFMIDAGANPESKPEYLFQHALMGAVYCQAYLNKPLPTVGLLNIGTEEGKGNIVVREAHRMIVKAAPPSFHYIGFIEGNALFKGDCDLVVCEGFVGNVVLKLAEGVADSLMRIIKDEITRGFVRKVGASILKSTFKGIKERFTYEAIGGAMLLGVNGMVMILHGASKALAFENGLKTTAELGGKRIFPRIREQMSLLKKNAQS